MIEMINTVTVCPHCFAVTVIYEDENGFVKSLGPGLTIRKSKVESENNFLVCNSCSNLTYNYSLLFTISVILDKDRNEYITTNEEQCLPEVVAVKKYLNAVKDSNLSVDLIYQNLQMLVNFLSYGSFLGIFTKNWMVLSIPEDFSKDILTFAEYVRDLLENKGQVEISDIEAFVMSEGL